MSKDQELEKIMEVVIKAIQDGCKTFISDHHFSVEERVEMILSFWQENALLELAFPPIRTELKFVRMMFRSNGINLDWNTGVCWNKEGKRVGKVDIDSVKFTEDGIEYTFAPEKPLEYITIELKIGGEDEEVCGDS